MHMTGVYIKHQIKKGTEEEGKSETTKQAIFSLTRTAMPTNGI